MPCFYSKDDVGASKSYHSFKSGENRYLIRNVTSLKSIRIFYQNNNVPTNMDDKHQIILLYKNYKCRSFPY